jgi:hypothetical protein
MSFLSSLLGTTPSGLPPCAYLPWQTQSRMINQECMHVTLVNALRALAFLAGKGDPGPLSVQSVGLAADAHYEVLTSPDQAFGTSAAGEIGSLYGACLASLCAESARSMTDAAKRDALARRCKSWEPLRGYARFLELSAAGPCVAVTNERQHAHLWLADGNGGVVDVDPFPTWTGKAKVVTKTRSACESWMSRSGGNGGNIAVLYGVV